MRMHFALIGQRRKVEAISNLLMPQDCEDKSRIASQGYLSLHHVSWCPWQIPRFPDPALLAPSPQGGPGAPDISGNHFSMPHAVPPEGCRRIDMFLQTNPSATRIPPNGKKKMHGLHLGIRYSRAKFQRMVLKRLPSPRKPIEAGFDLLKGRWQRRSGAPAG